MGWSLGWDSVWQRDIGYGVIAFCDHPKCNKVIDRGLAHLCEVTDHKRVSEKGCGLFFCEEHGGGWLCPRCTQSKSPYKKIKPDHPDWIKHKMTDPSWHVWRVENGHTEPKALYGEMDLLMKEVDVLLENAEGPFHDSVVHLFCRVLSIMHTQEMCLEECAKKLKELNG